MRSEAIRKALISVPESEYGSNYRDHLLRQYQLFVEMADRISQRRQQAHTFFLGIQTALIAAGGFLFEEGEEALLVGLLLAAILICWPWYRLVKAYRQLNSGKFKVIHEMEQLLPLAPYDAEWQAIGSGKNSKLYTPFSKIEGWLPLLLVLFYTMGLLWVLVFRM